MILRSAHVPPSTPARPVADLLPSHARSAILRPGRRRPSSVSRSPRQIVTIIEERTWAESRGEVWGRVALDSVGDALDSVVNKRADGEPFEDSAIKAVEGSKPDELPPPSSVHELPPPPRSASPPTETVLGSTSDTGNSSPSDSPVVARRSAQDASAARPSADASEQDVSGTPDVKDAHSMDSAANDDGGDIRAPVTTGTEAETGTEIAEGRDGGETAVEGAPSAVVSDPPVEAAGGSAADQGSPTAAEALASPTLTMASIGDRELQGWVTGPPCRGTRARFGPFIRPAPHGLFTGPALPTHDD